MKAERVRELLNAAPLVPSEVHMSNGKSFVIDHPEFAMFDREYTTLFFFADPEDESKYGSRARLDVDHITQITENPPRRPRRRRKKSA